jgi:hypothetical protein
MNLPPPAYQPNEPYEFEIGICAACEEANARVRVVCAEDLDTSGCTRFCPDCIGLGAMLVCPSHGEICNRCGCDINMASPWDGGGPAIDQSGQGACWDCCEDQGQDQVILVCGSRTWTDLAAIEWHLLDLPPGTPIVHGAARGADALADLAAEYWGRPRRAYPADWRRFGKGAGPMRNQQMLDRERPTRALAFRMPGSSPGTDDMIRRLEAAGIPVTIITPGDPTMTRFVSFKTPEGSQIVVNPDYVALFEPVTGAGQAACRLWFSGINFGAEGNLPSRTVLGTLRDVGLRLQPPNDPLGAAPRREVS